MSAMRDRIVAVHGQHALKRSILSIREGGGVMEHFLSGKGVRTARVEPLPFGPTQQWLRAAKADAELQTRLKSLPPERLGNGFQPCVNRPPPPAGGG